jgi:hypothetical protein
VRSRIAPLSLLAAATLVLATTAAGALPPPGPGDLQIGPNPPPVPSISLLTGHAYEADGTLHIPVRVADPNDEPVAFDYEISHHETTDDDFAAATAGNMSLAAGMSEAVMTFPLVQDDGVEGREGFLLVASNPVNATIYDGLGVGSIMDGDGPRFGVGDAEVVEGDEGEALLTFDLTASYPATDVITVPARTAVVGMGAEPPGDHTPVDVEVVFGINSTEATVQVPVIGDTLVEADELLLLVLDPPSQGELDDATGVGRILDDDDASLAVDDVALPEGTGGPTGFHFTVSLDQPALEAVTVTATATDGTATAPGDWQAVPVEVTFEPGQTEADVVVSVVGDSDVEADETFTVVLADAVGATIADDEGLGTILDDDAEVGGQSGGGDDGGDGGVDHDPEVAGTQEDRGALPRTGATVATLAGLGLVLLLAGTAVRSLRRRLA